MRKGTIGSYIFAQKTTLLFVILCLGGIIAAGQPLSFVLNELLTRVGRNTFLVLALLIPIQAGMGLNFAIVIGAMAAQIAVFFVSHWEIGGIAGLLVCVLVASPIAILFGYFTGRLFNKMKGAEMIGGMILGYFSDGLYQLLFLFLIGTLIPINNPKLMISSGIGVKNTIDLDGGMRYALDNLLKLNLLRVLEIVTIVAVVYAVVMLAVKYRKDIKGAAARRLIIRAAVILGIYALSYIPYIERLLLGAKIPVITYAAIGLLCVFNTKFMKTIMGQNMRTVGQSMGVATASGINVDKTRIIAIVLSTLFASWGQLILLQNMGTMQTYGAHTQVGQFAIASLLVGGASVHKASNKQALLGVILFHTLFIVSPIAGKNLFNNAQIGEYFRVFVSYGVIAVSLALHAWKVMAKKKAA